MRNLFSFIICHSCNLTNLRGTAVALLSFLTYAISTITVVGLKENQTNQHSEGALLATELHILTEIETKVMIKNEIFICHTYVCDSCIQIFYIEVQRHHPNAIQILIGKWVRWMKGLRYIGDIFILSKFLRLFLNKVYITIPGSFRFTLLSSRTVLQSSWKVTLLNKELLKRPIILV